MQSRSFLQLQEVLCDELGGKNSLVVGSAPEAKFVPHERCLCVNASGYVAQRLGLEIPDFTLISGYALRGDNEVRLASLEALRGRATKICALILTGFTGAESIQRLSDIGYNYRTLFTITPEDRHACLTAICGEEPPVGVRKSRHVRPSNGAFAAALALAAGARTVSLTGFSLQGGHAYIAGETPRDHVAGDQWFLSRVEHRIMVA